jgi:hypothetical protein
MGRFALLAELVASAVAALSGGSAEAPAAPSERLVLAVVGNERSSSAVHGERAVVADPRTGELNSFVLPGGTLCHGPLMAVGDRVVFSGYRGSKAFAMSLPLTLRGKPAPLGRADTITTSERHGRVWLGRWTHGGARSRVTFREVAAGEEATSRAKGRLVSGRLLRWSLVHAAVPDGFVVEQRSGLVLWDPHRARPLRGGRRAWPVATGGPRFAWCREPCRSLRLRTRAGERTLTPPSRLRLQPGTDGAFSSDGRLLALPVIEGGRSRAAVADLRGGEWTTVPGSRPSSYGAMAWSRSGDRLYLATRDGGLGVWQPGALRAERLPVDPGGTVMSIAVAGG